MAKAKKKGKETPLMQQYDRIKTEHPDALLLFRVGDFYETFGEDAIVASKVLGIVLTKRKNGAASHIELAGFPHHSLETYLPKLVRAGHRVAICDQLEDPKQTKTIVKRGVTEVVTPGVALSDNVVDQRSNNFLCSITVGATNHGIAFLDVTTGEFLVGEGDQEQMEKYLAGHVPSELLHPKEHGSSFLASITSRQASYGLEEWVYTNEFSERTLLQHFGTTSLKGFGIEGMRLGQQAAAAVLHYLARTHHDRIGHIDRIQRLQAGKYVWLDRFTVRNLELIAPVNEGATTLLDTLDHCTTPMGSRLLRRWVLFPLLDQQAIEKRLLVVEALKGSVELSERVQQELGDIGDLERLGGKAATGRINPRELLQLSRSLRASQRLKGMLGASDVVALQTSADRIEVPMPLVERIEVSIEPEAPASLSKGGVILPGVNEELDELRNTSANAKDLLLQLQQREVERTGIASLKVGFNNVFGYYLEVRNAHKSKVPEGWVRKQTLVSAERYITDELKVLEERILHADEHMRVLEASLFQELVEAVCDRVALIRSTAMAIARTDILAAFAGSAVDHDLCKPELNDGTALEILEGRHPVIEQQLPPGERYVTNDLRLDTNQQQMIMITGPNMSGKSALLRQTALITLMAQIGSFVPASKASIGLVDRIFTRVGASDNISTGESTFMVEMNETASILNNLSERSLVLLDEIGRGTSTYDGISIAWAIAEYLHEHADRPKTLFATHYHELNEMAHTFGRVKNYNVAVREVDGRIIFLRKLVPGGSDRSFGIHVAEMAGMPKRVIDRAQKVLTHMERTHSADLGKGKGVPGEMQLSFFQLDDPVLERIRDEIRSLDIDTLTPVEALLKLNEIKRISGAEKPERRLRKA